MAHEEGEKSDGEEKGCVLCAVRGLCEKEDTIRPIV